MRILGLVSRTHDSGLALLEDGVPTLVLEEEIAGGTTADAPLVENYLGFDSVNGLELSQKMVAHAKKQGVQINEFEKVTSLDLKGEKKIVKTERATYQTRAIVIASGSNYRQLGVPGEKEFRGRGVSYCGLCDGPLFKGKRLVVVGGGNSALITALYLAHLALEIKVVHRRDVFRAEEALVRDLKKTKNAEIFWGTEVKEIRGENVVKSVLLLDKRTEQTRELPIDGVFVQVGEAPNSQMAKEAGVSMNDNDYVIVDAVQHTNIAGVYAAGDVSTYPVKQIGTAVGQGITAALEAYDFIRRPYYKR